MPVTSSLVRFPIDTTEVRSNQAPVVYAIIAKGGEAWAPTFRVVDIGFSEDAGVRFAELADRRRLGGGRRLADQRLFILCTAVGIFLRAAACHGEKLAGRNTIRRTDLSKAKGRLLTQRPKGVPSI